MSWDESGRLFVVEMRGFMPNADGDGEDQPVGRVVMLLDDDGDGAMDRSEVFLDGLVMPLENGLMLALDNWIYNAKSDRRFRFDKGVFIEEKTLARGQWGIAQGNTGRLYYNTNSNFLSGDFFLPIMVSVSLKVWARQLPKTTKSSVPALIPA